MNCDLSGKTALVTGAAGGIGRAAALEFARQGAKVAVIDVSDAAAEETVRRIQSEGHTAAFFHCDVSQSACVLETIARVVDTFGSLDCAFNNAGIEGEAFPTADCSEENWDRVISINLKGVFLCMKYEIQQMLRQGGGAIVNTSSVAGMIAERSLPAYAASKGGVIQLTRTAAVEYAAMGIRINAVCPGGIQTEMIDRSRLEFKVSKMYPNLAKSKVKARIIDALVQTKPVFYGILNASHPLGRLGLPEEIAQVAVFLCTDAAGFITGQAIPIDGGMTSA